jgi:hypothetical protein
MTAHPLATATIFPRTLDGDLMLRALAGTVTLMVVLLTPPYLRICTESCKGNHASSRGVHRSPPFRTPELAGRVLNPQDATCTPISLHRPTRRVPHANIAPHTVPSPLNPHMRTESCEGLACSRFHLAIDAPPPTKCPPNHPPMPPPRPHLWGAERCRRNAREGDVHGGKARRCRPSRSVP